MRDAAFDTPGTASTMSRRSPAVHDPLLDVRSLGFSAGGEKLLHDVDVAIRRGSRTLIMGPNGAGKSLLLRLMHGLLQPQEGAILWEGGRMDATARRAQAMVFQRPVLLRRSVIANLKFALSVRGLRGSERADKVKAALETAGLSHLARRPARVLSGGEQQRLSLVRALACDPELLFLDEPTANLDPASTAAIESLVLEANARGVTVVLVTHDAGQAKRLGEDLVFLQNGTVVETGPVEKVLANPRSEPVRAWRDGRLYLGPNTQSLNDYPGRKN
ncbi:ABC transporter ATP-binding protein [Labrenzia sp. C1B10]|uniref:ATP-binding cassette domain-containing protein n=1 Tax=unclassified Labrenzia TaxID=2648686 RepID=UPI0003B84594|nr:MULTISPECIES: ATP-binding cassette domain-containing protein [unclassified Labrenzia]ERP86315.1 ABC transporter ATP-binding protein [Labrenzia sp. C1B10]ERS06675.1 ABC transporter ATP-binding protein [Labrenzia sp. C1B70]